MRRIAAPTAPRCRNTLQRKRASPWMPNERSSSLSSSNFCFCVSLRMLYASRCVSWGVNCSNWVSWVRRPLIRSCGYVPLVMWRSDPPRSTRICSRSAMFAAMVSPFVAGASRLGERDSQHLFDGRRPIEYLQEAGLPQGLHALRLRDPLELRGRRAPEDPVPELLADRHGLVDPPPPLHAREAARRPALALVERDLAVPGRGVAVGDERLLVDLVGLPARAAHLASETLGQDQQERGRDEERRGSHGQGPRGGRGAGVRVERDEDHAVGLVDHGVELLEAPRIESELGEVELQRVLVEDAEDRLLAEDRR